MEGLGLAAWARDAELPSRVEPFAEVVMGVEPANDEELGQDCEKWK